MTFFFETYGCQMNKAESSAIEQLLLARGWSAADSAQTADLIIINTCSVRATAESRVNGRLGWYTALRKERCDGKPFMLAVTGCMAERLKEKIRERFPAVDYVVGNFEKERFADIAAAAENAARGAEDGSTACTADDVSVGAKTNAPLFRAVSGKKAAVVQNSADPQNVLSFGDQTENDKEDFPDKPAYSFAPLSLEPGAFQAFVPIMHGCNNFCTFCIVPYVRGREISRPFAEIVKELDVLSERGVCEITLLGQNVNSYRWKDGGSALMDFPLLLDRIADHLEKTSSPIKWIRFMSSHPKDLSDDLIGVIKNRPRVCRHIHLPVQHGSSRILQKMNRRYSRETYLDLVDRIRSALPDVSLTTDILIGFPGETEADVEQTLSLMRRVRYEAAFMYYYNPREGTPACSFADQVPTDEKKARLQKVIDLQQVITKEEALKKLGQTVTVLAESPSRDDKAELLGHTERDSRVVFAAEKKLCGHFVQVRLDKLHGNTFRGTIV